MDSLPPFDLEQQIPPQISHTHQCSLSTNSQSMQFIRLWMFILFKAFAICGPVLIFLWIYFLPALVLTDKMIGHIRTPVYVIVLKIMSWFFYFGFVSTYGVFAFGIHLCRSALLYSFFPGVLVCSWLDVFLGLEEFSTIFRVAFTVYALFLIYREKVPPNPSPMLAEQAIRKTEVAQPLAKMVIVIGGVYFLLCLIFPLYVSSSMLGKMLMRFIALPLLTAFCSGIQLFIFKTVPSRQTEYAIPGLWISNGILKIFERLFTNSMFEGDEYVYFALSTFLASLIEIATHASYFYRIMFVHKLVDFTTRLKSRTIPIQSPTRIAPSTVETSSTTVEQNNGDWMSKVRQRMIVDDIAIELMMVFTVTFLLYFMNPLVMNERLETIPTFKDCAVKLLIQVAFEFMSDIFGLYWSVTRHKLALSSRDIELLNDRFWLWLTFVSWQSAELIYWFMK